MNILLTKKDLNLLIEQKINPVQTIVDNLWKAINRIGTDEKLFYNFISQIKDRNTLITVNKTLKSKYGKSLYDIINDPLEFNDEEKNNIVSIFNKNKLPHKIFDDGKILPLKITTSRANFLDPLKLEPSESVKKFIMHEEGDPKRKGEPVLTAYKKKGDKVTIGWGHTANVKPNMKITKEIALKFFNEDLKVATNCVKRIFNQWKSKNLNINLTQGMFDAMVSLAFNAGCGNLRGTTKNDDLIDFIKNKKFKKAAEKIKTFKTRPGFGGLAIRREKESQMFCQHGGCENSKI